MENYDVIIIGAGPAGSTAANILAKEGKKVLLADKENFPRDKLCGGLLTKKTLDIVQKVFDESRSELEAAGIIDSTTNKFSAYYRKKQLYSDRGHLSFSLVDRRHYDDFLVKKAVAAGAGFHSGEIAKIIDDGKVMVGDRVYAADFILGCDGASSAARTYIESRAGKSPSRKALALTFEVYSDDPHLKKKIREPRIYFGYVNKGYAWAFPNKDRVILGIGSLGSPDLLKQKFNDFLDELNLELKPRLKGCFLPSGGFMKMPYQGNILLCGDAGGFVDPILGEGIYYAHFTGALAASMILQHPEDAGKRYSETLGKGLYRDLRFAKIIRPLCYNFLHRATHYRLLMGVMKSFHDLSLGLIHGTRSYRWLRKNDDDLDFLTDRSVEASDGT